MDHRVFVLGMCYRSLRFLVFGFSFIFLYFLTYSNVVAVYQSINQSSSRPHHHHHHHHNAGTCTPIFTIP
jgi:hypothetical protein